MRLYISVSLCNNQKLKIYSGEVACLRILHSKTRGRNNKPTIKTASEVSQRIERLSKVSQGLLYLTIEI